MLDFLVPSMRRSPAPAELRAEPASRKPDIGLLLNPSNPAPKFPRALPRPPAPSMHPQRPPMHPHQYSSSSITSVSSAASSMTHASSASTTSSRSAPPKQPVVADVGGGGRRRFTCATCAKDFSTSGHLARHMRVHTGERNHPCPFSGCNARCSRQDNLVQHFRVHMPREERRASSVAVRAALARCMAASGTTAGSTVSSHTATPTHGLSTSDMLPPSPSSRSPSPDDDASLRLHSPSFSPDVPAAPAPPGQWVDFPSPAHYTSYVREPLPSPTAGTGAAPLSLPLPPVPSFPYSLPVTHPHPSYHPHPHSGGPPSAPHPSPSYHPSAFPHPPPLSPGSGSTLASANSGSPMTPGWQHLQQAVRVPVSAGAGVGVGSEWPWFGWDSTGEKRV